MVYANADLTKTEQAREIIAFADYGHHATGTDPGLLVFDSQLTTYTVLDELTARGIEWLTAPTRQNRTRPPRRATRLRMARRHHRPIRALPPPPPARRP